jgi:hypothetical protein
MGFGVFCPKSPPIYQRLPIDALSGIVCYNGQVEAELKQMLEARSLELPTVVKPGLYFQ